jgi:LPS-assembly lipoprotein
MSASRQSPRCCAAGRAPASIRGPRARCNSGPAPQAQRRRGLITLFAASFTLAGCGFELRRTPEMHFQRVQLSGFAPRSPLAQELRQSIDASGGTKVVDSAAQAQVVLEAITDARERSVLAYSATGLVLELELRARLNFRLRTVGGKELIAPTEILLVRNLTYSEGVALAKQYEEAFQFKSMQSDVVAQVIRRLAAVPAQ